MSNIIAITGGGSGMGLAIAERLAPNYHVVICGRTEEKLKNAVEQIRERGNEADYMVCDISNEENVKRFAAYARSFGEIKGVVNCAGLSPHLGTSNEIVLTNAMGTIYVDEAFRNVMEAGSCIINFSSNAGHMLDEEDYYDDCDDDREAFLDSLLSQVNETAEGIARCNVAYMHSKTFVIWYTKSHGAEYGEKGIRLLSISPGTYDTPMAHAELPLSMAAVNAFAAVKRIGKPTEMAALVEFVLSEDAAYLTSVDILMDGGTQSGQGIYK